MNLFKVGYKYKILLYFLLIFTIITLLFSYIFLQKDRDMKVERLILLMQPYTDIIHSEIVSQWRTESGDNSTAILQAIERLREILPSEMRITVLDTGASVIYDNLSEPEYTSLNRSERPEVIAAVKSGTGSAMRYSATLQSDYLYFAKRYPTLYVRTALEYNSSVLPVIKIDRQYQIYILIVLILSVVILFYMTRKVGKPFSALKEFVSRVEHGSSDYSNVEFPKGEFGEVGEKIIHAFRQLENTKRYKQELTHNIAHELKTPVTGIRGYIETILQQEDIAPEQRKAFLEKALAQSMRLSSIVNDISILNKIEEAEYKFDFEPVNISQCIADIVNDLAFKIEQKQISFTTNIDEHLFIEGNYLLIYYLFKNLIENSIEYAGNNIAIYIGVNRVLDGIAYFTYYDTGIGVPDKHLDRIFERFYRLDEGRSRKSGGSGLGLSIVRNSILLHKGSISAKNRESGGLQFDFTLKVSAK
jgi:Signal transduction histidine kinase